MLALLARPRLVFTGTALVLMLGVSLVAVWQHERAERLSSELASARAQVVALEAAVQRQNAAVSALKTESARRVKAASAAIQRAPVARAHVVEALRTAPVGADAAERMRDVDRRYLDALK